MPLVDDIGDRLPDFVVRDDGDLQVVTREKVETRGRIAVVGKAALDFEVIAPAAQLESRVAEPGGACRERFKWHIGPWAAKEQDWSSHDFPRSVGSRQ